MVENKHSFDSTTSSTDTAYANNMTTKAKDDREGVIYLNHAGQAWLDPAVQALGASIVASPPMEWHAEDDQVKIRQLFATLIEAEAKNIAVMPSTAFAMTLAARNIQRLNLPKNTTQTKNKILVLQDQFCSAVYPWQELCNESCGKVSLEIVQYPAQGAEGGWTQAVLEALTDDVLVACLPPLHWSDGALLDLEKIGKVCDAKNILYMVDATQAVGIMPCPIQACGNPLLLACSIHKWLRGPHGACLVYMHPKVHATWQPLDQHGRSRDVKGGANWDASQNEMGPKGYPEEYFSDARKFDSGGKPNPIILPMLRLGMEQVVERVEITKAQGQLKTLVTPLMDWACANGYKMTSGPHCYHIIGIRPTFLTTDQMLEWNTRLQKDHKIVIAVRAGAFRIAPYLDTTPEELQKLMDVLKEMVSRKSTKLQNPCGHLTGHVFAEQVLTFLDRRSTLSVMEVHELVEHFQLRDYYCARHGTKLDKLLEEEADGEEESDNDEQQGQDEEQDENNIVGGAGADGDTNGNAGPEEGTIVNPNNNGNNNNNEFFNPTCEDCVESRLGNERCPKCETFAPEEEIMECSNCAVRACCDCPAGDSTEFHLCHECNDFYCDTCEPNFRFCDNCCEGWCNNCEGRPFITCQVCHEERGCIECVEDSFNCGVCKGVFCYECKDNFFCDMCCNVFCESCMEGCPVGGGYDYLCRPCCEKDDDVRCEECGRSGQRDESFKCSECETITCSRCTKAYACSECHKSICADCQTFFHTCCCEKKGKFQVVKN